MKIRLLMPLLLAACVAMPALAQKPAPGKDKAQQTQPDKSKAEYFDGTVYFSLAHTQKAAPKPAAKPSQKEGLKVQRPDLSASVVESWTPPIPDLAYGLKGKTCFALLPGFFYSYDAASRLITFGVATDEPRFAKMDFPLEECKGADPVVLHEIASLQEKGNDEEANQLLATLYRRTDDTKEILGITVVRYEMLQQNGNLWVAEDYRLRTWFAPFWGLDRLVLEYEAVVALPAGDEVSLHLVAEKIDGGNFSLPLHYILKAEQMGSPDEMGDRVRRLTELLTKKAY